MCRLSSVPALRPIAPLAQPGSPITVTKRDPAASYRPRLFLVLHFSLVLLLLLRAYFSAVLYPRRGKKYPSPRRCAQPPIIASLPSSASRPSRAVRFLLFLLDFGTIDISMIPINALGALKLYFFKIYFFHNIRDGPGMAVFTIDVYILFLYLICFFFVLRNRRANENNDSSTLHREK